MTTDVPGNGPFFDREITGQIKGAALAMMFFHHFFTFPAWIVADVQYPLLTTLAPYLSRATRLCVAVFAFLNGYLTCWQPRRGIRAAVLRDARKATDFLLSYWTVYALLLLFARVTGRAVLDPRTILLELFGLSHTVMPFNWYVPFYLLSLPCIRLLSAAAEKGPLWGILCGMLLPCGAFTVLASLRAAHGGVVFSAAATVFENARDCFPAVAAGYLAARYDLFRRVFERELTGPLRSPAARTLLCVLLAVFCCAGRYLFPAAEIRTGELFGRTWTLRLSMDAVWAPLFVWSLARLFRDAQTGVLCRALSLLGRSSMLLWFWHCAFFNVCRDLTQPLLYAPKLPPLVWLWGLALCLAAARLTEYPLQKILRLKNRLLFPEQTG